jgi:hypothetical protein
MGNQRNRQWQLPFLKQESQINRSSAARLNKSGPRRSELDSLASDSEQWLSRLRFETGKQ